MDPARDRTSRTMTEEELLARLIYRDGLMLIIDKPTGLPVHPGPGGGPNMEQYFDLLRFGLPRAPALAHRLDRDTSGCLVLGRHRKALQKLGKLFAQGRIEKTYWAIVAGTPAQPEGRIALPLRKLSKVGGWRMVADAGDGQEAVTDYRVLGHAEGMSWVEFRPHTGRTHQIRVHAASGLGCPVWGDPVYGEGGPWPAATRLHLLARRVVVPLYPNRDPIAATAAPPPHMTAALAACGFTQD